MWDGSPVDTSIFSLDSSSKTLKDEFIDPRQLEITSDGSVEQQGVYEMVVQRSLEDYPDAYIYSSYYL